MRRRQGRLGREEGQVLVLACLMLLVLSLAVLTTVEWGHSVHERIRLQNNADAAAYSMAALEARAFNLYSYTNRSQVSHDVSAMAWQSTLSFVFFLEAFVVDVNGMVKTFAGDCSRNPLDVRCVVRKLVPVVDVILSTLQAVLGLAQALFQWLPIADRFIGKHIIPLHQDMNEAMAGTASAMMHASLIAVEGQMSAVVRDNDPDVNPTTDLSVTTPINHCLFERAHMRESGISPAGLHDLRAPLDPTVRSENNKTARAKRAISGIANATRYFCDSEGADSHCRTAMTTSRTWEEVLPGSWGLGIRLLGSTGGTKWGQTRMLTHGLAQGYLRSKVSVTDAPAGMLAQGDNLGSDDVYRFWSSSFQRQFERLGLCRKSADANSDDAVAHCWGDPLLDSKAAPEGEDPWPAQSPVKTSIWAMNRQESPEGRSLHWRVAYPRDGIPDSPEARQGLTHHRAGLLTVYTAHVRGIWEDNHPWRGVTPFPHFEPGQFDEACEGKEGAASLTDAALGASEFNQPSSWVVLRKTNAQMKNGLERGKGMDAGLHAVSRAQTYYHRPGNWSEMPNFFNPYWRARLASVYQGRRSFPLVNQWMAGLPEPFKGMPQKVITH